MAFEARSFAEAKLDPPAPRAAWIALGFLMAGAIVSMMDRGVITLLVEPIKATHGLSDTQFASLQSLAFGTFYVLAAIPIGVLADRFQRRIVIAAGMALFSLFSIGSGLARTYTQLFISRTGVGVGEASLSPTAYSLISDYFPPKQLGRAASLFMSSNYVGSSSAYMVGGAVFGWLTSLHANQPELLYGFQPWQLAIIIVALPGAMLAPCFLLLREPPRRMQSAQLAGANFRETVRALSSHRGYLLLMLAGMSMASAMTYATSTWIPALFIRVFGWSATKIGLWFGAILFVGGILGSLFGGWMTDRLTARGQLDAPMRVAMLSYVGVGIFGVLSPLMPTPWLSLALLAPVLFLKPIAFSCAPMSLQLVIPNELRARTTALYFTAVNLVGVGFGPILVGVMSDRLFTGPTGIRYALAAVTALTVPIMIGCMALALAPYRRLREPAATQQNVVHSTPRKAPSHTL